MIYSNIKTVCNNKIFLDNSLNYNLETNCGIFEDFDIGFENSSLRISGFSRLDDFFDIDHFES